MKKNFVEIVNAALLVTFLGTLSGCLQTRSEVAEQEEKKNMQKEVTQLQRTRADQDAQFQNYEAQFRTLNGRVEALEYETQRMKQANDELGKKLASYDERFKTNEQALLQLENMVKEPPKQEPPAAGAAVDSGKKKSLYDEGDEVFAKKEWKKAISLFQKYRDKFPNGPDFSMATYKIGVCFQELKMNKEARLFFEEAIEKFPKSKAAKASSFRLSQMKKK